MFSDACMIITSWTTRSFSKCIDGAGEPTPTSQVIIVRVGGFVITWINNVPQANIVDESVFKPFYKPAEMEISRALDRISFPERVSIHVLVGAWSAESFGLTLACGVKMSQECSGLEISHRNIPIVFLVHLHANPEARWYAGS